MKSEEGNKTFDDIEQSDPVTVSNAEILEVCDI